MRVDGKADLERRGKAFVVLQGPSPESRIAYAWTANAASRYREVCDRRPEWVESRYARGAIPPCLACQTLPEVSNCDPPKVESCHRAMIQAQSSAKTPVTL